MDMFEACTLISPLHAVVDKHHKTTNKHLTLL
jgi:hypothetical protein